MFSLWTLAESSPRPGYSEFHDAHCCEFICIHCACNESFQSGNWYLSIWGIKKIISLIISSPPLFSLLESQLYMCSLLKQVLQHILIFFLPLFSYILFCLSALLCGIYPQLLFLLPIFHSKNFLFSKHSSPLLKAF